MAAARRHLRVVGDPAPPPSRSRTKEAPPPALGKVAIDVTAARLKTVAITVRSTAPLMVHRFSEKAMKKMTETQEAGQQSRAKKTREARNFREDFLGAQHISATGGWSGLPAGAFRTAMIDACRLTGIKMTMAKMSIFVEPEGFDKVDGTPLVRILGGKPEMHKAAVRNDNGSCDLRARPMWRKWSVDLRITFDEDQFSLASIVNLLNRAGQQVGVGEGRPFSRMSTGIGFGRWLAETGKIK